MIRSSRQPSTVPRQAKSALQGNRPQSMRVRNSAQGVRLRMRLSSIFHFVRGERGFAVFSPASFLTWDSSQGSVCQSPRIQRC